MDIKHTLIPLLAAGVFSAFLLAGCGRENAAGKDKGLPWDIWHRLPSSVSSTQVCTHLYRTGARLQWFGRPLGPGFPLSIMAS